LSRSGSSPSAISSPDTPIKSVRVSERSVKSKGEVALSRLLLPPGVRGGVRFKSHTSLFSQHVKDSATTAGARRPVGFVVFIDLAAGIRPRRRVAGIRRSAEKAVFWPTHEAKTPFFPLRRLRRREQRRGYGRRGAAHPILRVPSPLIAVAGRRSGPRGPIIRPSAFTVKAEAPKPHSTL